MAPSREDNHVIPENGCGSSVEANKMSWEEDDFELPSDAAGGTAAAPNVATTKKPKALSLEAKSFQKRKARAMEEKAELEAKAAAAAAAVEKAKAQGKAKTYIASLENKAKIAAKAVAAKEMDIIEASAEEGKRVYLAKCTKRGVLQPCYERDVLGVERDPITGKILYIRQSGY